MEWNYEWTNEWMVEWIIEWMNEYINKNICIKKLLNKWRVKLVDAIKFRQLYSYISMKGKSSEWMREWMNEGMNEGISD